MIDTGESFNTREPWTSFTIYAIAARYPSEHVYIGNAVPSIRAQKMGARLALSGDGKMAHYFGMKVVPGRPFRYDTELIVLCDNNARVLRIWKSAGLDDIDDLLKEFMGEKATLTQRLRSWWLDLRS